MKKSIVCIALGIFLMCGIGCTPRMMSHVLYGATLSTAILGTLIILEHHDSHHHHDHCGCPRHFHNGHWVYYYHDQWEYYDPHVRVWYMYTSESPHNRRHHRHH